MNDYYVYAYIRSKDSNTAAAGTPYYIGKGKKRRAFAKHNCPVPTDRAFIQFLHTDLTNEESKKIEMQLIAEYGRKDIGTGILHNLTDGGEGTSGYVRIPWNKGKTGVYTESQINKMKESAKLRPAMSQEARDHLSRTLKGRVSPNKGSAGKYRHSDEQKQKISASKIGKKRAPMTEEQKLKISAAQKGKPKPRRIKN